MDRGAWQATVYEVARVGHDLASKPHSLLTVTFTARPFLFPADLTGRSLVPCKLGTKQSPVIYLSVPHASLFTELNSITSRWEVTRFCSSLAWCPPCTVLIKWGYLPSSCFPGLSWRHTCWSYLFPSSCHWIKSLGDYPALPWLGPETLQAAEHMCKHKLYYDEGL